MERVEGEGKVTEGKGVGGRVERAWRWKTSDKKGGVAEMGKIG